MNYRPCASKAADLPRLLLLSPIDHVTWRTKRVSALQLPRGLSWRASISLDNRTTTTSDANNIVHTVASMADDEPTEVDFTEVNMQDDDAVEEEHMMYGHGKIFGVDYATNAFVTTF